MEVSGQLRTPAALLPGKARGNHWIGGWVCLIAVLDTVMERKIPSPRRESNPRTPIVQPVTQRYTDVRMFICACVCVYMRVRVCLYACVSRL
jgi:hypothetical protein